MLGNMALCTVGYMHIDNLRDLLLVLEFIVNTTVKVPMSFMNVGI